MYLLALTMGLGCGVGCGSVVTPFITSYVIGKRKNVRESLVSFLSFSFGKIMIMIILGAISSFLGQAIISEGSSLLPFDSKYIFNGMMLLLGIHMLYQNVKLKRSCNSCKDCETSSLIDTSYKGYKSTKLREFVTLSISGVIYGLTPCAPLGIMLVTAASLSVVNGALLLAFFGCVTCISPVIFQCLLAGMIVPKMKREIPQKLHLVSALAGCVLIFLGISPLLKLMLGT